MLEDAGQGSPSHEQGESTQDRRGQGPEDAPAAEGERQTEAETQAAGEHQTEDTPQADRPQAEDEHQAEGARQADGPQV